MVLQNHDNSVENVKRFLLHVMRLQSHENTKYNNILYII